MLKVLIADDEFIVRVGLKSSIDWQSNGFEVVAEASNGREAMDIIENERPDIVITDIKMPVVDGIELLKNSKNDNIEFIILSCYDDFEIVKEAMKLGAHDYFLKLNMDSNTLLEILKDVKDKIEKKRKRKENDFFIEKNIYQNMPLLRKRFFNDLICNNFINIDDMNNRMKFLNVNIIEGKMVYIDILIDQYVAYRTKNKNDIQVTNMAILNIIEELIQKDNNGYAFYVKDARFGGLIFYTDKEKEEYVFKKVLSISRLILKMLKKYVEISVSIGISDVIKSINEVEKAYKEAAIANEDRYYRGRGSINKFSNRYFEKIIVKEFEVKNIEDNLKDLNIDEIKKTLDNMIMYVRNNSISKELAYSLCFEASMKINNFIQEDQGKLSNSYNLVEYTKEKMESLEIKEDIEKWIIELRDSVISHMIDIASSYSGNVVLDAKRYVKENYSKGISIEDIADNINISSNYLGKIFKKETECTLINYLTDYRINMAMRYIKESKMKMYQIAEAVGYSNVYYFSKVFKKVTGNSPLEYKKTYYCRNSIKD